MEKTSNFLEFMHELQQDSSRLKHFAREPWGEETSTMPATAFVYQFFLYNSVYQINWEASTQQGCISRHLHKGKGRKLEPEQQDHLECFLRQRDSVAQALISCFKPLTTLNLTGDWTAVKPDDHITSEKGEEFFVALREIQEVVRQDKAGDVGRLYYQVGECRKFIYEVRCNIFHGRKTLREINDPNQEHRIKVYLCFLNCLMTWFFKVTKQHSYW